MKHLNLAKVGISAIVNFIEMIFWPFRVLENKYFDLFIGTDFSRKVTVKILSKNVIAYFHFLPHYAQFNLKMQQ